MKNQNKEFETEMSSQKSRKRKNPKLKPALRKTLVLPYTRNLKEKKVKFSNPPAANDPKKLTDYNTVELIDVYMRYVHIEAYETKENRKKTPLKTFSTLFNYFWDWLENFSEVADNRKEIYT